MNIARYAFTTYTQNRHKKWPGQTTATATATTGTATAINRPSETTDVLPIAGALLSTMLYATLVEGAGGLMTKQRPPSGRDAPSTDTLDTSVITTFPFFGEDDRQQRQLEVIADKLKTVVLDSIGIPLDTRHIIDNWQREEDNTQWTTASRGIKRLITSRSLLSAKDLIQHMGNNMPDFTRELKVRLSLGPEDVPADAILSSIILKMCTES